MGNKWDEGILHPHVMAVLGIWEGLDEKVVFAESNMSYD